jgi:TRPM family ion channel
VAAPRRTIPLPGGHAAIAAFAPPTISGADAAQALGLSPSRALIVLNGGTAELSPDLSASLRRVLGGGLARVSIEEELPVVTGGTDAGIFAILGQALGGERTAPCVGVVPAGRVVWGQGDSTAEAESSEEERVPLEPHHSHFLLVEGDEWGIETDAMLALCEALSAGVPSLVVLAGGGAGARREVLAQLHAGREVVVIAGTGRFADALAGASAGTAPMGEETAEMLRDGRVTVVDVGLDPSDLADLLRSRLIENDRVPR